MSGLGDWKPFSVTKEFRDALTNATHFLYNAFNGQLDHCLAYGYFNARPREPYQMPAWFISPAGFGTSHLEALLIRLHHDVDFHLLSYATALFMRKLVAEWDSNSRAVFPRRLLVVVTVDSQNERVTRIRGREMQQIKGVFVDMRFPRRGTVRPWFTYGEHPSTIPGKAWM